MDVVRVAPDSIILEHCIIPQLRHIPIEVVRPRRCAVRLEALTAGLDFVPFQPVEMSCNKLNN